MTPEQKLLDSFRAAALSVTQLYKNASSNQTAARSAGYQECLEDLLSMLDRNNIGLCDGDGWAVRSWATERLNRENSGGQPTGAESEDDGPGEVLAPVAPSTPAVSGNLALQPQRNNFPSSSPEPTSKPLPRHPPTLDSFTFSSVPLPNDTPNIASLALSDSSQVRRRHGPPQRPSPRPTFSRSIGQKRKINVAEFFQLPDLDRDQNGPDKRQRQT